MGIAIGYKEASPKKDNRKLHKRLPVDRTNLIYAFYDGSFLISFCVYASLSYDVFFFYHKAYSKNVLFMVC